MPIIESFNGIKIELRYREKGHNRPHVHAYYAGEVVSIAIDDGKILSGHIRGKQQNLAKAWVLEHSNELMKIWKEVNG